jgi:hypothetical protein
MLSPLDDEGSGPLTGSENAVEFVKKIKCVLPEAATKTSYDFLRFTEDAFGIVEDWLIFRRRAGFRSKNSKSLPIRASSLALLFRIATALRGAPENGPPSTETLYS